MADEQPLDTSSLYLLGQIDSKVTALIENQRVQREEINIAHAQIGLRIDKEANRITALERSVWKIIGIAGAVPTAIAALGVFLAIK